MRPTMPQQVNHNPSPRITFKASGRLLRRNLGAQVTIGNYMQPKMSLQVNQNPFSRITVKASRRLLRRNHGAQVITYWELYATYNASAGKSQSLPKDHLQSKREIAEKEFLSVQVVIGNYMQPTMPLQVNHNPIPFQSKQEIAEKECWSMGTSSG